MCLKRGVKQLDHYSIKNFLESLTDDDLEKVMIEQISEGKEGEDLLDRILEIMVERKK